MFFGGMPFGDFDDMGGMPGMPGRRKGPIDNERFYKVLEVSKDASDSEIKKAYRKLAMKHHPDKGGDPETFKGITKAYEILSDADKRRRYDQGGEDAVSGEAAGGEPTDIFDALFSGGRRGGGGAKQKRKTPNLVHPINVPLELLYNGGTKKVAVNRDVLDHKAGVKACEGCDGRGVRIQVIRMGPMIQQAQSQCGVCGGTGKFFKTKREREILEVHIPKGASHDHKVTFAGKADEHPDAEPGDVVFVVKQKDHADFDRRGSDLYVKRTITLLEALAGYTLEVEHLDGRKLVIKSNVGEVTTPLAFDPLGLDGSKIEWEALEDTDSLVEDVAKAETTDVDGCKNICEKKDFTCFTVDGSHACFKRATRDEVLAGKKKRAGCTLYVPRDPAAAAAGRLCKAVKGEGMPTPRNPFVYGNLFIVLTIEFPTTIDSAAAKLLRQALPKPKPVKDDEKAEVHFTCDMDPVASQKENAHNATSEAYDEDEDGQGMGGGMGGQRVQCNQQ